VLALAQQLKDDLSRLAPGADAVCLAAEDKTVVAAALLAAACGGPALVVPHDLSPSVIAEARAAIAFSWAIVDSERTLPTGVRALPAAAAAADSAGPATFRLRLADGDRRLLWLFTGGSTGQPKLWSKSIQNIFGEADHLCRKFQIGPQDRILATVPPFHVYGLLFSVVLPLVAGAATVNAIPYFPAEIARSLREHDGSILVSSPMHYQAMAASPPASPSLRLAFSSGGFLAEAAGKSFYQHSRVGVTEVYGSTETGGIATRCLVSGESRWQSFVGVRTRIDDERLYVSSPFLSPELPLDKDGYFRTGDRARASEDEKFHLLGRADGVVKVGGQRVVLDEIRTKLMGLAGVSDALVFALPVGRGRENEIVALLVTDESEAVLRQSLEQILTAPARPRRIRLLERIPLSPMGKPDLLAARALFSETDPA